MIIHLIKCTHENKRSLTKEEVQKLLTKSTKMNFTEVRVSDIDISNRTLYLRDAKLHRHKLFTYQKI